MNEPSILDYLKSLLRGDHFDVKAYFGIEPGGEKPAATHSSNRSKQRTYPLAGDFRRDSGHHWPIISRTGHRQILPALALYLTAGIFLWLGFRQESLTEFIKRNTPADVPFSSDMHLLYFAISMVLLVAAFLLFNDNTFTLMNLSLWVASIVFFVLSIWERKNTPNESRRKFLSLHYS